MASEKSIKIDGMNFHYKEYHSGSPKKLIALHGWLDNAASFDVLAPHLKDFHVLCLDLPGHGLSGHDSAGKGYLFSDWVVYLAKFIYVMNLGDELYLLGHSMGAGICTVYASLQLQPLQKIFLIDGLVPVPSMQKSIHDRLASYVKYCIKSTFKDRAFKNQADIFIARKMATPSMPDSAVQAVMIRQCRQLDDGSWKLLSDPFLSVPSAMTFSENEVSNLVENVSCDVVFFRADDPYYEKYHMLSQPHLSKIKKLDEIPISGSHYIHFECPEKIAGLIQ